MGLCRGGGELRGDVEVCIAGENGVLGMHLSGYSAGDGGNV